MKSVVCSKPGFRSLFQFELSKDKKFVTVFFDRFEPGKTEIELRPIGTVPNREEFWKLVQSSLLMMDDDTWAEPEEWAIEL